MPSSTASTDERFFTFDEISALGKTTEKPIPIIKGRVWNADEHNQTWAVECENLEDFEQAVKSLSHMVDFLAYDRMELDEDALHVIQEDLEAIVSEEHLNPDLAGKACSALRSHRNETFTVVAYAFLKTGQVLFVRSQNELARFVQNPDRLLSNEGISCIRKLKTLAPNS